jgi:hypothetical protein
MAELSLFGPGQHAELAQRFASSPGLRAAPCRLDNLVEFLRHGPDGFLRNGHGTRAYVALAGDAVVPLVVNDGEVDDCYLVSPRAHYILYMIDEMRKIEPRWLSSTLQKALAGVGAAVTAGGLNRIVSIDNWLLTTSPINPVTIDELRTLTRGLQSAFPTHALVYRCIDPREKRVWNRLSICNYEFIMNRPVHEIDLDQLARQNHLARRHTVRDQNLAEKGPLRARTSFKLRRGSYEWMEYEAFFVRHLPRKQQWAWRALATIINFAGTHLDSSQI